MSQDRWIARDLNEAVNWCKMRNKQGIRCVFDILGEFATNEVEVAKAVDGYLGLIDCIDDEGLNASVTIKLTALGALFDMTGCSECAVKISKHSAKKKIGFEIDMEGRDLVQYTLEVAESCLVFNQNATLALQAYLDRTADDFVSLFEKGLRPRLVKGAYIGDTHDFTEIQTRFKAQAEKAVARGSKLQIGTHDPELIGWAKQRAGLDKGLVEFGFLKGLADSTKIEMVECGWSVCEYVPYGKNYAPYIGRRLKYLRNLEKLGRAPAP